MNRWIAFVAVVMLVTAGLSAQDTPAEIVITDTVIASDVQPLGANLTTIAGGTNLATNNLIRGSGMEPGIARYLVRVERSGPGWIEWDESLGGVHMWDQVATGFGDGATVRLYRLVDADGNPLNYGGELQQADAARDVVFLGETTVPAGGWIAEGSEGAVNRVLLADDSVELAFGDYAVFTVTKVNLTPDEVHPRLLEWFEKSVNYLYPWSGGTARLVAHTGDLPAAFVEPGDACLEVTAPEGGAWFGQYLFHAHDDEEGQFYSQLEPGESYRAEVWLRQEGLADGRVYFHLGGAYDGAIDPEPWQVTGEWAHYTYDFTGPDYPDPDRAHGSLGIAVESAGTVWVDNFVVYRHDYRPFTPHHVALDELLAALPAQGPKPVVRFYPTLYHTHSTMDRLLSNYPNGRIDFIYNVVASEAAMTVPHIMEWALATGDGPADRVVPYITLSEEYTEVEWAQLVEYLGVPYDPAVDTPGAKPWAYRRYQQRGSGTPWTDEFREIVLEFGNETWHNGAGGYGWHGFGRPGWVWQGGREYGLFARHYFVEHVMAQSWWRENNLDDKITFALNAGYSAERDAYGELAVQQVPDVFAYLGHANYVGPKWETEDETYTVFDDFGMQETLVGGYVTMFPLISQVKQTRDALMLAGQANYRPVAYEGGPSGYAIPGTADAESVRVAELYGKSLGMAVGALDAWLYSSQNGYGHQAYLGFEGGQYWSSHTMPRMGGFRRHTGWLALTLRNRFASGSDMLETTVSSTPTYDRLGEAIPLISAYTLRDDDETLSLFVLSRSLDQTIPVEIQLPVEACSALTRHALTAPDGSPADPRSNNIDAENIVITSTAMDAAACAGGTLSISMPPGTVHLYVIG